MSSYAIEVQGLGKRYRLGGGTAAGQTFREMICRQFGRAVRRGGARRTPGELWALRDINVAIEPGEVIGVIGPNGAGKSTLLKVLAGITDPTVGRATLRGRVASLLEVGTGFHPELSGRENIYLNGSILGMTRAEIRAKFDQIVEFSGVADFLETPVKRYSSGMSVRLAFAVAAHLESEILIVDEVLAVGDAAFQAKCLGKMREVAAGDGRTVLLVSHNMDSVLSLASDGMLIDGGRTTGLQPIEHAVRQYFEAITQHQDAPLLERPRPRRFTRGPSFAHLQVRGEDGKPVVRCGGPMTIDIEIENLAGVKRGECGVVLSNATGQRVAAFQSRYHSNVVLDGLERCRMTLHVPQLWLTPGTYHVDLVLADQPATIDQVDRAGQFEVVFADVFGTGRLPNASQGVCVLPGEWKVAA